MGSSDDALEEPELEHDLSISRAKAEPFKSSISKIG
tara:strand:- start:275 stop:382 length:108 start_codon:yes stop_codon:yes gene_type:complete